ncbi:unnamed protein product [Camellia sinensis]
MIRNMFNTKISNPYPKSSNHTGNEMHRQEGLKKKKIQTLMLKKNKTRGKRSEKTKKYETPEIEKMKKSYSFHSSSSSATVDCHLFGEREREREREGGLAGRAYSLNQCVYLIYIPMYNKT